MGSAVVAGLADVPLDQVMPAERAILERRQLLRADMTQVITDGKLDPRGAEPYRLVAAAGADRA